MSERLQLEFMPLFVQRFEDAVAEWSGVASGLYALLLLRQWKTGYIPADIAGAANVLRVSVKELRPHWEEIRAKFEEREQGKRIVLVNARLEAIYEQQSRKYENYSRANKSKGQGRKQKASKPEANPNQIENSLITNGEQTERNLRDRKENSPTENTEAKASGGGSAPPGSLLEGVDLTQPFGMCYAVLCDMAERAECQPPPHVDARKHLKGTTGLLPLVRELGIPTTCELVAWVWEHRQMGMSFKQIYDVRHGLLGQMREGIKVVPRKFSKRPDSGLVADLEGNPFA